MPSSRITVPGEQHVYCLRGNAKIITAYGGELLLQPGLSGSNNFSVYAVDEVDVNAYWLGVNAQHDLVADEILFHYTDRDGLLVNKLKKRKRTMIPQLLMAAAAGYGARSLQE